MVSPNMVAKLQRKLENTGDKMRASRTETGGNVVKFYTDK